MFRGFWKFNTLSSGKRLFWKSINIWRRYRHTLVVYFLGHSVLCVVGEKAASVDYSSQSVEWYLQRRKGTGSVQEQIFWNSALRVLNLSPCSERVAVVSVIDRNHLRTLPAHVILHNLCIIKINLCIVRSHQASNERGVIMCRMQPKLA